VVEHAEIRARTRRGVFLPTAFDPSYTVPATVYLSVPKAELQTADQERIKLEHAHPALVIMLVLTQLSVGGFLVEFASRLAGSGGGGSSLLLESMSLWLGHAGLAASLFHLGRPHLAYRAILGWRHSWLSREVLAFGCYTIFASILVAVEVFAPGWVARNPALALALLHAVVVSGLIGVGCSVMVYHVVRRPFWRASASGVKFAGTIGVLGLATALASLGISKTGLLGGATESGRLFLPVIAVALAIATAAKLLYEALDTRDKLGAPSEPLRQTARLLRGPLKRNRKRRVLLGFSGGIVIPLLLFVSAGAVSAGITAVAAVAALAGSIGGEVLERFLFFRAVTRPRMPGGLPS
jgi:DMSO reductase anchor subunit